VAARIMRALAEALGYDVVRRTIYSPIPVFPDPTSPEWQNRSALSGIEIDTAAQLAWLERELAPHFPEIEPALAPFIQRREFSRWNGYFQGLDLAVLFAMLRHLKPHRLIEVGSGFSTRVAAAAAAANAREGRPLVVTSIDPEPRTDLAPVLRHHHHSHERIRANEVPVTRFLELAAGDVLFIDSSHTVKRGSEVNYLVLEILPRLRSGVVVHFHDIFLPEDYPRAWFERGTYLSEQYLVQAYLAENRRWEVVFAAHAVARDHAARLLAAVRWFDPSAVGQESLWIRRR
jgi:predicted O-methyltransferase YrrM